MLEPRSLGLPEADVDIYIKTFIEQQARELGLVKVLMSLWVKKNKQTELFIQLDLEGLGIQESEESRIYDAIAEKHLEAR